MNRIVILLSALLLTLPQLAFGAGQENIRFDSRAEVEVKVTDAQGKMELKREPAARVLPGSEVIFVNQVVNEGAETASGLVVTNPVPANMEYVGGSATGAGTVSTFSIDGGKTFAAPDQLLVKNPDGTTRVAAPREYTHIRWTLGTPLPSRGATEVEFRAKVK